MENAIGKLIRQNEELLRKNHSLQKQGRMIVEEKIEIMRRWINLPQKTSLVQAGEDRGGQHSTKKDAQRYR